LSLSEIGFSFAEAGSEAHRRLRLWRPRWSLWLGLAIAFVAAPLVGSDYWFQAILIPVLVMALAGLGLNILTGYAGQASLGTAAFMSVGAFATYNFLLRLPWLPLPVSIALGGVVAALVGLLFGLPSLRIKGFYLLASTLAAQFSIEWLFSQFPWFFNNASSGAISAPRLEILGHDIGSPLGRYLLTLTIVGLLTWLAANLVRSQIGRNWMAVRDMDTAAAVIGIPIMRTKLLAFAVSSFYCGVAGALWAFAYLGTTDAHGFDLDQSFEALFIIIIGGMGSIFGNLLGAAFIVLLPIALNNLTTAWHLGDLLDESLLGNLQKALFGALIIWFLIKEPDGLARLLQSARERLSIWPLRS
jgi:branched-chain amino acid transport system permease protein